MKSENANAILMKVDMNKTLVLFIGFSLLASCSRKENSGVRNVMTTAGQMPSVTKDKHDDLHVVYGIGDSIMYINSQNGGQSFSKPGLIAVLPHAFSFAMRGPQIAATDSGIVVIASTSTGDIFSFYKIGDHAWVKGQRVNDVDTIAKEGLTALSADGQKVFAAWLDLRSNKKNKIYGAASVDGGNTWTANKLIYASPDTTVCECCKPSVIVRGSNVFVMFRNWLNGNRDMYVAKSADGGTSFGDAQKLGEGSWQLNGCPMDGGGMALNESGELQTIWRRQGDIFFDTPGTPEKKIGTGKNCTIERMDGKNVHAWVEDGKVVVTDANGSKKIIGKGSGPLLKGLENDHVFCVWENEKELQGAIIDL